VRKEKGAGKRTSYFFGARERCQKPFRGAWRGPGASGFFGLSRLIGSTNESDKTDPGTSYTPSEIVPTSTVMDRTDLNK
jgi:hypothetical protein